PRGGGPPPGARRARLPGRVAGAGPRDSRPEAGAGSVRGHRLHLPAHRARQAARQGEAETRTLVVAGGGSSAAEARLEDPLALSVAEPGAVVLDPELHRVALGPDADLDAAAAVATAVLDQRHQDALRGV